MHVGRRDKSHCLKMPPVINFNLSGILTTLLCDLLHTFQGEFARCRNPKWKQFGFNIMAYKKRGNVWEKMFQIRHVRRMQLKKPDGKTCYQCRCGIHNSGRIIADIKEGETMFQAFAVIGFLLLFFCCCWKRIPCNNSHTAKQLSVTGTKTLDLIFHVLIADNEEMQFVFLCQREQGIGNILGST